MDKYFAIFKIQITNRWAYAGNLLAQSLTIVMFMWIFLQLWQTTYKAAGKSVIAGLSLSDTLWYLMIAETIMLSKPRLSTAISQSIKDGSIAYILNKPYNFIFYQISIGLGDSLSNFVFNALAGGITVWILVGPPPSPSSLPMTVISILLAWFIHFWINILIGLAAFITEDVSAFDWIYSKFLLLLGGVLIPLDFFPTWLQSLTKFLPFSYMIYGPARLFVDPNLTGFLNLVVFQSSWILVLGAAVFYVYRQGSQWLAINGG